MPECEPVTILDNTHEVITSCFFTRERSLRLGLVRVCPAGQCRRTETAESAHTGTLHWHSFLDHVTSAHTGQDVQCKAAATNTIHGLSLVFIVLGNWRHAPGHRDLALPLDVQLHNDILLLCYHTVLALGFEPGTTHVRAHTGTKCALKPLACLLGPQSAQIQPSNGTNREVSQPHISQACSIRALRVLTAPSRRHLAIDRMPVTCRAARETIYFQITLDLQHIKAG